MATYNLKGKYETLISSLSNELSSKLGRRVSKIEVLETILDVVIKEEELFRADETEYSFFDRHISKTPTNVGVNGSDKLIERIKSLLISFKP